MLAFVPFIGDGQVLGYLPAGFVPSTNPMLDRTRDVRGRAGRAGGGLIPRGASPRSPPAPSRRDVHERLLAPDGHVDLFARLMPTRSSQPPLAYVSNRGPLTDRCECHRGNHDGAGSCTAPAVTRRPVRMASGMQMVCASWLRTQGVGLEIRELGQPPRVNDLVGFADAQDRPPGAGGRVELIAPRLDATATTDQAAIGQTSTVTPHARSGRSLPPR